MEQLLKDCRKGASDFANDTKLTFDRGTNKTSHENKKWEIDLGFGCQLYRKLVNNMNIPAWIGMTNLCYLNQIGNTLSTDFLPLSVHEIPPSRQLPITHWQWASLLLSRARLHWVIG